MRLKKSKGKIVACSLICVFVLFVFFVVVFVDFVLFVLAKPFRKKKKKFKIALMTSFTLLLNSSYY